GPVSSAARLLPLQRPSEIQSELRLVSTAPDPDRKNGPRAVSSEERIDHLQEDGLHSATGRLRNGRAHPHAPIEFEGLVRKPIAAGDAHGGARDAECGVTQA